MMPLMAINWYIVDPTPCSTCSHRPFPLRRWKALKPIIVFLEGRLPPWTLWHTFKESGRNVFRPDSVALALGLPSPHLTHMQLFFLERVNMCESHCSLELFSCLSNRELMGLTDDVMRATLKKKKKGTSSTARTFPVYLKRTSSKTKTPCRKFTTSFYAAQITPYIMFVRQNNVVECVSDVLFAKAWL